MKLKLALILSTAAVLAAPMAALSAGSQIGVNAAIRNSVQMKTSSDAGLRPAVVREAVHIGDQVASGSNSSLQVLLLDRSVFTVGSNARMTIDRFVYDPNRGSGDMAASVARGSFRFMSGRTQTASRSISTPSASIGVRGTIVEGVVGPDVLDILKSQPNAPLFNGDPTGATLVILRGPGPDSQGFDKVGAIDITSGGVTITLDKPGLAALVFPGQAPLVFFLSDPASAALSALLLGAPNGSNGGPPIFTGSAGVASGGMQFPGGDFGGGGGGGTGAKPSDLPAPGTVGCTVGQGGGITNDPNQGTKARPRRLRYRLD